MLPSSEDTVMVEVPSAKPFTTPSATDATEGFPDIQTNVVLVAFSGNTVAVNVASSPVLRERLVSEIVTFSTATSFFPSHPVKANAAAATAADTANVNFVFI